MIRVGFGYDAHRLVPGRPLVLGGESIAFELGLQGHSDADVVVHALCDALLGAAALGDLGGHFPDTDPRWQGVSSITLLERVGGMIQEAGFLVGNLDTTIVAEAPRLGRFIPAMVNNIASALSVEPGRVSVKATTTEGMGFAGRGEGIAAYAVVVLRRRMESADEGRGNE